MNSNMVKPEKFDNHFYLVYDFTAPLKTFDLISLDTSDSLVLKVASLSSVVFI